MTPPPIVPAVWTVTGRYAIRWPLCRGRHAIPAPSRLAQGLLHPGGELRRPDSGVMEGVRLLAPIRRPQQSEHG
jgi:hypothetical protein